ncbi:MAG TPA: hypothetical protein VEZ14_03670 [Dehalococcoidia bacterium]|nr:hypothetical protein [Dehalococcoidia bacterium]
MNSIATLLLTNKLAAGIAVAVLATGAAAGTFAAQDKLPGQSSGPRSEVAVSPTPHATEGASATDVPQASETPRAIKGIPTTNPHFQPSTDGTCTAGESAVKTTPAGTQVMVPCQAIEKGDNGKGADTHGNAEATERSGNSDQTPDATEQPDGTPGPGNDTAATAVAGAGEGHDRAMPTVPTPHSR